MLDGDDKVGDSKKDNNQVLIAERIRWITMIWGEQNHIIDKADSKASLYLTICAVLFAGVGFVIGDLLISDILAFSHFHILFSIYVIISIGIPLGLILFTVFPRIGDVNDLDKEHGIGHFQYITEKIDSSQELLEVITNMTGEQLVSIGVSQVFALANIASKKMKWIRISTIAVGWAIFSTILLLCIAILSA